MEDAKILNTGDTEVPQGNSIRHYRVLFCKPWPTFSCFFEARLHYPQGAVVNSPPTVDLRCGARQLSWGKSFRAVCVGGGLGNGPRVTGCDLADYSRQHLLLCRQDLVAAGWGCSRCGVYRRTIHAHADFDGNCFSGGATFAGLLCVEIPGAAFVAAGGLFARQCKA